MSYSSPDLISEDIVSKFDQFSKEIVIGSDFCNDGDKITFWTNRKGNFKVSFDNGGRCDVYFGLDFGICLIKRGLLHLKDLKSLYYILINDELL